MRPDPKPRTALTYLLLIAYCLLLPSCSIPNLEPQDCIQARDIVREFYSFHFGNEKEFSEEAIERRRPFFTPSFLRNLQSQPPVVDPFTLTDDPPKAFRVGGCRVKEADRRVTFDVLLFWKTDIRTEQRSIAVEVENTDGKWMIDSVGDANTF